MTKTIVLAEEAEINGAVYTAGEVVQVDDDFTGQIKSVLVTPDQFEKIKKDLKKKVKDKKDKQK